MKSRLTVLALRWFLAVVTAAALLAVQQAPATAQVTQRGTGIQASSASSYTVPWPSGTVAGDMAIITGGGGWVFSTPSGWTSLDNSTGPNWNGAGFYKILTAGDISTGHVVVSMSGTFDTVLSITTVEAGTFEPTAVPTIIASRNSTGSSSTSLTGFLYGTNDLAIYFGSNRAASTNTINLGTLQRQANDGSAASGALYTQNPSSTTPNPTFSYSSAGSGNYQTVVGVKVPNTVPSWIRGTGIQAASASSFVVMWPSGTAAGDGAVVLAANGPSNTPSGWTLVDNTSVSGSTGRVFYKVLNSTDISTGSVTITPTSGTEDLVVAVATIKGSSLVGYGSPVATMLATSSGGTSSHTVNYTSSHTTDYALYFGVMSVSSGGGYGTVSLGNYQQGINEYTHLGGALFAGSPASVGTISPTFTYNHVTSGDYQGTVLFAGPTAVPTNSIMHSFPP